MKENARQGFWNGALPPIGYRIVAAEQRGAKIKKKLGIDPIHADTVRLIYKLALTGDGDSGPMGIKSITKHLNERNIRTRDGGRWDIASVHQILKRTTYIGEHRFNTRDHKTRAAKPDACGTKMEPIGGTICGRSRNASRSSIRAKSVSSARKLNCSGHLSPPRA